MATDTPIHPTEAEKNLEEAKKIYAEAKRNLIEAKKAARKRKRHSKEEQRKSKDMDDASLLTKSATWQGLFEDHLAEFTAFDVALDNNFATGWNDEIDKLEGHPTDETMMDEVQDKTQTMEKAQRTLLKVVSDYEYFVKRAFPDDERKLMEFGFETLRTVRPNYSAQLLLLTLTMGVVVNDYQTEMQAAGMPNTLDTDLGDALSGLLEAEMKQEYAKRLRIRATTERIKMFNDLYHIHLLVKNAAKSIFYNNEVVARQFE